MKLIKCLLTRHHWLLIGEQPTHLYEDNEKVAKSRCFYECQVCGKIMTQNVTNLDNFPGRERL